MGNQSAALKQPEELELVAGEPHPLHPPMSSVRFHRQSTSLYRADTSNWVLVNPIRTPTQETDPNGNAQAKKQRDRIALILFILGAILAFLGSKGLTVQDAVNLLSFGTRF
jgi:hypothetical protein